MGPNWFALAYFNKFLMIDSALCFQVSQGMPEEGGCCLSLNSSSQDSIALAMAADSSKGFDWK
jgi:hypothetical protein